VATAVRYAGRAAPLDAEAVDLVMALDMTMPGLHSLSQAALLPKSRIPAHAAAGRDLGLIKRGRSLSATSNPRVEDQQNAFDARRRVDWRPCVAAHEPLPPAGGTTDIGVRCFSSIHCGIAAPLVRPDRVLPRRVKSLAATSQAQQRERDDHPALDGRAAAASSMTALTLSRAPAGAQWLGPAFAVPGCAVRFATSSRSPARPDHAKRRACRGSTAESARRVS
jgi:hypothetical protein